MTKNRQILHVIHVDSHADEVISYILPVGIYEISKHPAALGRILVAPRFASHQVVVFFAMLIFSYDALNAYAGIMATLTHMSAGEKNYIFLQSFDVNKMTCAERTSNDPI